MFFFKHKLHLLCKLFVEEDLLIIFQFLKGLVLVLLVTSHTYNRQFWFFNIGFLMIVVKLATIVEGDQKVPFSIATTPMCKGGRYSFPGLLYFTLDPYIIMLSVKQGGIKYHFLSLWYDSTWDWTQVSRVIGEHSNP